jgi:hypothetical protein
MEQKTCTKCKKTKSIDHFAWRIKARNRRQSWCKECHRKENKNRYYSGARKQQCKELTKKYRKYRHRLVNKYKTLLGCSKCGYKENAVALDLHHSSDDKKHNVSLLVTECRSIKTIKAEIRKCTVFCANCHRIVHHTAP